MKELTAATVKGLYAMMTQYYNTAIIDKRDSALMKLINGLLKAMRLKDTANFLKNASITLGYDIYLPFLPGANSPSLIAQVMTCAHEHQHVVLMEHEGSAIYNLKYVFSPASRAVYEAECYRANMEVFWWYTKATRGKPELIKPASLASQLKSYGCSASDCGVAQKSLEKAARLVKRGGLSCKAAISVIRFFGWDKV